MRRSERKAEKTVNLVRPVDSEYYEYNVSDFDLTLMRGRFNVIPEKPRFDEKTNTHVRYYIRSPK